VNNDDDVLFFGYRLMNKKNWYIYPQSSSSVGFFQATDDETASYFEEVQHCTKLAAKCVCVPLENGKDVVAIHVTLKVCRYY